MHDIHGVEVAMTDAHGIAGAAHAEAQHRIFGRRQSREVRPDDVVEQVRLYGPQCLFARIYGQGYTNLLVENTIGQHRQSGDVVEMGVRQEDMTNRIEIGKAKEALEKKLIETETVLSTLQQQVNELTALSDSRQQQITSLESENSALERARDGLQTRLETTRDELDKTTGELKTSRAQLEQETISAEQFRKQLAVTQQEKEQIDSEKRQLEDELQKRAIRITGLEEQQQKAVLLEQQLRARLSTTNDLLAEARALATEKDAVLQEQQQTIEAISDERVGIVTSGQR